MSEATGSPGVEAALDDLKALILGLSERLTSLESRVDQLAERAEAADPALLAVISAACAAYLGKRAQVKQMHLRRDATWARQGRADVQHSHALHSQAISHGRR